VLVLVPISFSKFYHLCCAFRKSNLQEVVVQDAVQVVAAVQEVHGHERATAGETGPSTRVRSPTWRRWGEPVSRPGVEEAELRRRPCFPGASSRCRSGGTRESSCNSEIHLDGCLAVLFT
jgi:hypothetical protein